MDITYSRLKNEFEKYTLNTSQEEIQAYLELEYEKNNFQHVLELLVQWGQRTGYYSPEMLKVNKHYSYLDQETGVRFTIQINYQRDRYQPLPMQAANGMKLHCLICIENIGLPGKENLRVFQFRLPQNRKFFIQLTPYPLREKHFVLVELAKNPMRMDKNSVADLVHFVDMAPDYVGCSNSDVEWAGASILAHHHYQVFEKLHLPIMQAKYHSDLQRNESEKITFGLLNFPMACCKIIMQNRTKFIEVCGELIHAWKTMDPGRNTCNLIVHKQGADYVCYLIFRNPKFRTTEKWQAFKTEGVGIIEVAGEGILPVPKGENAQYQFLTIQKNGLNVIKGIIGENNPIQETHFPQHFQWICAVVEKSL
ncbi:MAG: hypothetical protein H6696_00250 [Deferribacteres bacterium]|nr:hypothetical protein [candidate division KSB1 bacterium]MCB9500335.1 hypothetical protein [Deferribacteres bacterium]